MSSQGYRLFACVERTRSTLARATLRHNFPARRHFSARGRCWPCGDTVCHEHTNISARTRIGIELTAPRYAVELAGAARAARPRDRVGTRLLAGQKLGTHSQGTKSIHAHG